MTRPMEKSMTSKGDSQPLTTFVQTDTKAFREIVQRLTGLSDATNHGAASEEGSAASKITGTKRQTTSKLRERINCTKPKLVIQKPINFDSKSDTSIDVDNNQAFPSPSTILSKLTISDDEKGDRNQFISEFNIMEEEKAIRERRFYLHPSPRSHSYTEPQLLPLFPLTSPRDDN